MFRRTLGVIAILGVVAPVTVSSVASAALRNASPDPPAILEAPMRQVALGISVWPGREIAELDAFTSSIGGQTPATWTIWSQWGSPARRDFPFALARGVQARGATPMIWWEPVDPRDLTSPEFARHANITSGRHDDYIRRYARDARAFDGPVILRFAHEPNGGYFPWGVEAFDNTAESFVAAWRHVHRVFEQEGAGNVRFLWSVARKKCDGGCNAYREFYPGDAYVDMMGFTSYNWGEHRDNWVPMLKGFTRVTEHLSEISSKPIIAVETGSNAEGGDKADWIRDGYRSVYRELPAVVAIIYLHADLRELGHPDWRLTSPGAALAEYAEIAALPRFQGRLPG